MSSHSVATRRVAAGVVISLLLLGGCSSQPKSVASGKKAYSFWPEAPDEPHIQFLATFNSNTDVEPEKSGLEAAIYGKEPQQLHAINKPYGVRMWNGRIYVCDIRNTGITVLDLRKQQTRLMGAIGTGTIRKAVDLAIAPDGTKYVLDSGQQSVLVFSPEERFVNQYPLGDCNPVGIALHGNFLYVSDFKNARVLVLDRPSGKPLRTIGERGGEDGQFIGPLAIATDNDGNVYVTDTIRARIQKFSPEGKFLMGFGEPGDRPGNFVRPKQIGIGSDGHVHIVDAAFNNVQVFDPEGNVVGYYGSPGKHPGAMDLPAGLDIDEQDIDLFAKYIHPAFQAERLIVVTNQFGPQKVSVYAMGHLKPGKSVADLAGSRATIATGTVTPTSQPATTQPVAGVAAGATKPRQ